MRQGHVAICVLAMLSASCGEIPLMRTGTGLGGLAFTASSGSAARGTDASRMITDTSMEYVSGFYEGYGNLVGKFTPSSIILPISLGEILMLEDGNPLANIFIRSPVRGRKNEPAQFEADFVAPIDVSYVPVPRGRYDRLELRFNPGHTLNIGRDGSLEDTYTTWSRNSVVVDLPGYGGQLTDVSSITPQDATPADSEFVSNGDFFYDLSASLPDETEEQFHKAYNDLKRETFVPEANTYYERKHESGDTYAFTLQCLYPRKEPATRAYVNNSEAFHVQSHVFTDKVVAARMANEEERAGSGASILLPFVPIDIENSSKKATVTVAFNATDLIEVYDNGTPDIKADDIVVLANKYWERFSVSISYMD